MATFSLLSASHFVWRGGGAARAGGGNTIATKVMEEGRGRGGDLNGTY